MLDHDTTSTPAGGHRRRPRLRTGRAPRARIWQAALVTGALAVSAVAPVFGSVPVAAAASVSGVVNTYQAVSSVSGSTVTVTGATRGAASSFAVGDRVMLIQMTGVSPAQPGSDFGNYDTATITAVSGSSITLSAITRTYSPNTEAVQLVRMEHDTAPTTVTGTVTAAPWDGATGGVVAMSGGSLVLNADIDASETGFTNQNPPTGDVVPSLSSGPGSTTGRGEDGGLDTFSFPASIAGGGGGGIGGGGGATGAESLGTGGGAGGGGASGDRDASFLPIAGPPAAGSDGGIASALLYTFGGADGAAGGGGGVIGGGGGGGSASGAGGGGTDGGGAGGEMRELPDQIRGVGAGGGGPLGVGNGGDGLIGGISGNDPDTSANEGSAGGGGGSYGGGGGAPSNWAGGDDASGGGGGGSWTGGGEGGLGGALSTGEALYPAGGAGNAPVADQLPESAHYLDLANPRLMMGGAGGRGSQEAGWTDGGAGGGIVFLDFADIRGAGDVRSDGGEGASPAGGGAHSGAGGGAGGQMRIRANTIENPLVFAVNGGLGGAPTANLFHGGVSGGGGGAGGIWVELLDADASCPAEDVPNITFELAGGNGGPSIINPKNDMPTATGGDGGTGLGCVSPKAPEPELVFDKASDPVPGTAVKPGDEITYAVTIENPGTVATVDGLVTDDMAEVLDKATLVSAPAVVCEPVASSCGEVDFTSGDTDFIWRSTPTAPLDAATTATVFYTVMIDDDATGTVGNLLVEPDVLVEHPIIEWAKTNDVGDGVLVAPGDTVEYRISVTNTGSVDSAEFSAVDDLSDVVDDATFDEDSIAIDPAGLGTAIYDATEQTLTWTGALEAEQTVEVTYAVTVNENAAGELRNAFFDTTVVNPISAALQWTKVDDTVEANPLAGAEWELTPLDGDGEPAGEPIVIVDCVEAPCSGADTDPEPGGFLVADLEPGDYELVETKAPFGFVLDATPITVTVLDTTAVTVLDDIVNEQQPVPSLPFSGGLGSEQLMILGGAFLALMTGLGAWQAIRRRRAV
ncbi:MAG: SpaA isopeptide-forming pilin-related protein [Actinomycetota bacterium]